MPASDQFAPGFEGIVLGLIVVVVLLMVFIAFHKPIIRVSIHLYYRIKRGFLEVEADIHNAQESKKEN